MSQGAIKKWQEKINFLEEELAKTSDADQRFSINERIREAKAKISELLQSDGVLIQTLDATAQ